MHCGFIYFMKPCLQCNKNYYCHFCTNILKSCHKCSQILCNNCKNSDLVKCSNCDNKLCKNCISDFLNDNANTQCIDCVLFSKAIENEKRTM